MEFIVIAKQRSNLNPERQRELVRVFNQWQPPEGFNMKSLYFGVDNSRAFGVVEADDSAALLRVSATFVDYIDFEFVPVIAPEEGAAIAAEMNAWVDQVKGG